MPNDGNWKIYADARNKATKKVKLLKQNSERKIAEDIKTNPKSFGKTVNQKTKTKPGITD